MDRLKMLKEILSQNPADRFARYGLAMEYSKSGQIKEALQEFNALLELDPDYSAAYFMAAQTLAREGRNQDARKKLEDGVAAAIRTGNAHARSEMQAMLDELSQQP